MTRKAREFIAANKRSPIVYGSIIGKGGRGCIYRLADDSVWTLNRLDCASIGVPRWAFFEEAAWRGEEERAAA